MKNKKSKDKKNNKIINYKKRNNNKDINLDKDILLYGNNYNKNIKKCEKINKIKDIYIPANTEKLDSETQRINSKMEYINDNYFIKGKKKMFIPANKYL